MRTTKRGRHGLLFVAIMTGTGLLGWGAFGDSQRASPRLKPQILDHCRQRLPFDVFHNQEMDAALAAK